MAPPTLGAGEQQVVGAVHTEHRLAVALSHVDALQSRQTAALRALHRADDTPTEDRKAHRQGDSERETERGRQREGDRETGKQREGDRETGRQREGDRQTGRQRGRQRDRDRATGRQTDRYIEG